LSGDWVEDWKNWGTSAIIGGIVVGAVDWTYGDALADSPDPLLPGQRAIFIQNGAVEEGRVPLGAIGAGWDGAVFECGVVEGDVLGAGAGIIAGEVGLVDDASGLAGGVSEVPLLPGEAGFVERDTS